MQQLLFAYINKGLFSDYYLEHLLKNESEWKIDEEILKGKFNEIKKLYESKKEILANMIEGELEDKFIRPILKILGHNFIVPSGVETTIGTKRPDYAFFENENDSNLALKNKDNKEEFYKKCIAIGEAKKWEKELDKWGLEKYGKENPSLQINIYLKSSNVKWGILTNGRNWRICWKDNFEYCYEIDLVNLLEKYSEDFKYFYLFFNINAFPKFLDKVHNESINYAKEVGEELKENVYKVLEILANGFLDFKKNKLSEKDNEEIRENSFIFLYRLLFCLYAENKKFSFSLDIESKKFKSSYLLPRDNEIYYEKYSLFRIKEQIRDTIEKGKEKLLLDFETEYYDKINKLFNLVNEGRNDGDKTFYIPSYNGGLFNPEKREFLTEKKVSDKYIGKIIYLLTVSKEKGKKGFIDYSSLNIKHLGSIYEGLLEYKLEIAKEKLVVIREKGKEFYVSYENAKKEGRDFNKENIIEKGEVYNITDKGERKATGSYYTPDYIVKYIVENTLKPIVEEKCKKTKENGKSESKAILTIKVLDPAMGSGHFLVSAVEFLAEELVKYEEISIEDAKREIVSNCIYGVDLNELAVELAKVSLWLFTVAKNKPLSFLEHRLKCGNSLIGAKLEDLPKFPEKKKEVEEGQSKFEIETINPYRKILAKKINELSKEKEEKLEDIRKKEDLYKEFKESLEYDKLKTLADVYTSIYFGNMIPKDSYRDLTARVSFSPKGEWEEVKKKTQVQYGIEKGNEKKFFHWELEFPEVFFENGGFDCVIGNPPYMSGTGKGVIKFDEEDSQYFKKIYKDTLPSHMNLFGLFLHKGIELLKENKKIGFIVPNFFLTKFDSMKLREFILFNCKITHIIDLDTTVFEDSQVPVVIVIFEKQIGFDKKNIILYEKTISSKFSNDDYTLKTILQNQFEKDKNRSFVLIDNTAYLLLTNMEKNSKNLGEIVNINYGIVTGKNVAYITNHQNHENKKMIRGEDIGRYYLTFNNNYIYYNKLVERRNIEIYIRVGDESIYIADEKGLIKHIGEDLIATCDTEQYYPERTACPFVIKDKLYNLKYIIAILNSKLLNFYYKKKFIDIRIQKAILNQLPIPLISFSTPKEQREEKLENAKQLYQKELANT